MAAASVMWSNSLTGRAWNTLQKSARTSATNAFLMAFKRMLLASLTARLLTSWLKRDGATAASWYRALLQAFNNGLFCMGAALGRGWRNSLPGKLFRALHWREACENSWLAFSPRKACLGMLALFLPLDVILRTGFDGTFLPPWWDKLFLAFGMAVVVLRRMHVKRPTAATAIDVPMLFFMAIGIYLWLTNSPDMGIGFTGLRTVVQYMLWFFVVSRLIETKDDIKVFLYPFLALGAFVALHGLYQYIVGAPMPASWVSAAEGDLRTRAYSIIGSPNIMGSMLVLWIPLMAAMAYTWRGMVWKIGAWVMTALMCVACMVTFSRGAWIGLAVAMLLFALIVDRRLLLLLVAAVLFALAVPSVAGRIGFLFSSDYKTASNRAGRGMRWAFGLDLWASGNPWLGFGLGRFGGATAMNNQVIGGMNYFYLDNYYLKTLVEMGLAGLLSFIFLCVSGLFQAVRSLFTARDSKAHIALPAAIFAGAVGVLAHCYFENIFEVPTMVVYFWALLAIACRLLTLNRAPKEADSQPA